MELLRLMGLCVLCLLPVLALRKTAPEQALLPATEPVRCLHPDWK